MTTIGVQVIVSSASRGDWLSECVRSLQRQRGIEVTLGNHIEGDLTAARLDVMARQETEWVSWVDPDDVVPDGAFEALAAQVEPGVSLVTGDETLIRENGTFCGNGAYFGKPVGAADIRACVVAAHKGIVRREAIPLARQIVADDRCGIDWALMLAATLIGEVRKVDRVTYLWRRHATQMHRLVTADYNAIAARFDALKAAR